MMMTGLLTAALLCAPGGPMDADALRRDVDAWHAKRIERLTAPDGWLTLAGLFWLNEGDNRVGSAPDSALVFPGSAPLHLGTLVRHGRAVELRLEPGVVLAAADGKAFKGGALASDKGGAPTRLRHGSLVFFVIERSDRVGVRLRDEASPARKAFAGLERFPVRPEWRIEARFEPYVPKRELAVSTVIGTVEPSPSPGALVFAINGQTYRLDTVEEEGEDELFVIFGDQTNGKETYAAGRFLYVPRPDAAGRVAVDFNRSYNPPCAFTTFATCPLPPAQNRLKLRVEAGEKAWGHHP
jgi:uncharacterized protein (DUF1684 family)